MSLLTAELAAKRLEVLHEAVPKAPPIAVLVDPKLPDAETVTRDVPEAARSLGLQIACSQGQHANATSTRPSRTLSNSAPAPSLSLRSVLSGRREQLVALAVRHAIPAIIEWREFADAGGLMSYGTEIAGCISSSRHLRRPDSQGRQAGRLAGPTVVKVEFVINLKTAKTLGLTFPITLLGRADEVIE